MPTSEGSKSKWNACASLFMNKEVMGASVWKLFCCDRAFCFKDSVWLSIILITTFSIFKKSWLLFFIILRWYFTKTSKTFYNSSKTLPALLNKHIHIRNHYLSKNWIYRKAGICSYYKLKIGTNCETHCIALGLGGMGGGGGGKGPFIYKVISDEGGSLLNILHNYKGSVCVCLGRGGPSKIYY